MLERILKLAHQLSQFAIWIAGALTLLSALYITVDIIFRKFFNLSIGGSDEISSYIFAISISWALSYVTLERTNIRIDTIYQLLPVRIAAILDWLALTGLSVFIAFLTRYTVEVAYISWNYQSTANTILGTPLWIPQALWILGFIWLSIILILMQLRSTIALFTGKITILQETCGVRTTKEEAKNEAEIGKQFVLGEK